MGQRVITSLNHFDLKKIKIKIIIMQIKEGKKSTRGIIFLVTKKNTRGKERRKKQREKVEK